MIVLVAALIGGATGVATSILLYALRAVTELRLDHPALLYGLAPAGLLTAELYRRFGRTSAAGTNLILDEIHAPRAPVPLRLAPLILFTTTLTHLVGGSAGREGSAVQMGGALAERLARAFDVSAEDRRALLTAGLAAGFAAAIGAPLAGAVFGVEVLGRGAWRRGALAPALVAAGVAVLVARALHAPHGAYGPVAVDLARPALWPIALGAGVVFGLTARAFVIATHAVEGTFARLPALARPVVGGALLSALYLGFDLTRYAGLGLDVIERSLSQPTAWSDPVLKFLLTALTLGSGFKGGEFIPLVFIGTTLGAALSVFAPTVPLAALGFGAVFGAAANTPLAGALMAAELFGAGLFWPALVAGLAAFAVSGHPGIYRAQPRPGGKRRP